jgi:hypothetical protein
LHPAFLLGVLWALQSDWVQPSAFDLHSTHAETIPLRKPPSLVVEATLRDRKFPQRGVRDCYCEQNSVFKASVWLNDLAWNNKGSTLLVFFLSVLISPRGNQGRSNHLASCCAGFGHVLRNQMVSVPSVLIGASGVVRIAALVVKYLDRSRTNNSEGILQVCFH